MGLDLRPRLLVRLLPRRLVTRLAGWAARRRWPRFVLGPFLRAYVGRFGARMEEADRPLASYETFTDFFTRPLRADARPMPEDPRAIASPCDGHVAMTGTVEGGSLLQVKGVPYALADLLGEHEAAKALEGGTYAVFYLAPGDYHRFHWPFDGRVRLVRRVPGDLWSVDDRAVRSVPGLFVRNERVVALGETSGGPFAYVAVGALVVGSVRLAFHDVPRRRRGSRAEWPVSIDGRRGDAFGHFELGSTVVLALGPTAGRLEPLPAGTPVRLGQPVGRLASPGGAAAEGR